MGVPPVISAAGPILSRYRAVFCDVWGVVYDGVRAYDAGCAALARFRAAGGAVVLLTNAPTSPDAVAQVLGERGVPRDAWDAIVSSGALAREAAESEGLLSVHHIGTARDLAVFDGSPIQTVRLDDAQAIFCTELRDDQTERAEDYRQLLETALARSLPFVCANPDLVVDVGGDLRPCAGSVAALYEEMGGTVIWRGKPFAEAYAAAHTMAQNLVCRALDKADILAIGDAVRTDIRGAHDYGVDALFVGQGIHRDDVMASGEIDEAVLARLFDADAPPAIAATATLAW